VIYFVALVSLSALNVDITVKVVELYPYATFEELYEAFDFSEFGCEGDTMQDLLQSTNESWGREKIEKHGALGIRIKLI